MTFDLSGFLDGTDNVYRFNGQIESKYLDYNNKNFKITDPIDYNGEVFKVDGENFVHIDIFYRYESQCDRCLNPTSGEIKTVLSGKLMEGSKKEYSDDEEEEIIQYENDLLNPEEYIKIQVITSIPMKFLCNENCKGICPRCGKNLNKESCNCLEDNIDPRLEKLKDFFSEK